MTELPALEEALRAAAERRRGVDRGRRRLLTRAIAPAAAAAAVIVVVTAVAVIGEDSPGTGDERSVQAPVNPAATTGFARQRALLGVLRDRLPRDSDPQVADEVRGWRRHGPRRAYARLLGKAPSGSAFVLVPVRRYDVMIEPPSAPGQASETARDGLCLVRRGTQGGAGVCGSTDDLLAGRLWGALARQVYGLVPDGVTAVQPLAGAPLVPVHRNFYVYDDPRETGPIPPPAWCRSTGRCSPTQP